MDVNSLIPEVDPAGNMQIRYKPEETPATLAAKRSYLGRVYLSWAQYPITETEELIPGIDNRHAAYRVRFIDLRYAYPEEGSNPPLGATCLLTSDLKDSQRADGHARQPAERKESKARMTGAKKQ